jgi:cyanophycin synthetase
MLKITARSILDELEKRDIPTEVLEERYGLIRYRHLDRWHLLRSCASENSSWLGSFVARHKQISHDFLKEEKVHEPSTALYQDDEQALAFMERYGTIVVKPTDGGHGDGVTVGVKKPAALRRALKVARTHGRSGSVILQEQVGGDDVRILIVGGTYTAAALRIPAQVVGDGKHTVRELIDIENQDNGKRGKDYAKRLNFIDVIAAERYLGNKINTLIPDADETVRVTGPANIGAGGTSVNVTDEVPTIIRKRAERIADLLHLPTCGVDFMTTDVSDPESYRYIELNACPSFGLHLFPTIGEPEPVAKKFVDYLLEQPA